MSQKTKKINFPLLWGLIALSVILILGIISPKVIEHTQEGWKDDIKDKLEENEKKITDHINYLEDNLISFSRTLLDSLSAKDVTEIFEILLRTDNDEYVIEVFDEKDSLLAWNNEVAILPKEVNNYRDYRSQAFFHSSDLKVYFSFSEFFEGRKIFVSIPIEKKYRLPGGDYSEVSLENDLSEKYNLGVKIFYSAKSIISKDGRVVAFPVYNNFNNQICTVEFAKPTVESELYHIENIIFIAQSFLALLAIILFGVGVKEYFIKIPSRVIKIILLSVYLIGIRVLLYILGIPSDYTQFELTNPIYFSSSFGFGIVQSPVEFFLTGIPILIIAVYVLIHSIAFFKDERKGNKAILYIFSFFLMIFILIIFRGYAASIRSFIFDSSIRYFKETTLLPDLPTAFMQINILLLSMCTFIFATALILFCFKAVGFGRGKSHRSVVYLFVVMQMLGVLYDVTQNQPQGTPVIRILLIFSIFFLALFVKRKERVGVSLITLSLIFSSVFSIALMNHYNSSMERKSLKITAQEITRSSEGLMFNLLTVTLSHSLNDNEAQKIFTSERVNYNSEAFKLWSKSGLSKEAISSNINIIDTNKTLLGSFGYKFTENFIWDWNNENEQLKTIKTFSTELEDGTGRLLRGIAPVEKAGKVIGYIEVSVLKDLNSLGFEDEPMFLATNKAYYNTAVNLKKLKIFEFHNNELINYYTDLILSKEETDAILNTEFTKYNDAWLSIPLNKEQNVVYVKRNTQDDMQRIIAVALGEKDLSWNLFDFFKVFFVHSLYILGIIIVYLLLSYREILKINFGFRAQLFTAFIIISVIPLMLLAFYFRALTEDKNRSAVFYKLGKRADQVEQYLADYTNGNTGSTYTLYDKAAKDLQIDFSVYKGNNLIYSSKGEYYDIGLLPIIMEPVVYKDFVKTGLKEFVTEEQLENYKYNAFYHKANINGDEFIIKVSDIFNRIQLPMSGVELDVFLFGTYSLALILVVIASTLLANQIGAPIRKLTNAMKAVGVGDLSIEVKDNYKGEVKDLVTGFNRMVKELNKSQASLAEMERETAWKEMARQVAHEIKNPLTPMKLSVQQLIASYNDQSPKFDMIFQKVTKTVITQIDNLKNIASEFSNFARMPKVKLQEIDLSGNIRQTVDLFSEEPVNIDVIDDEQFLVNADSEHVQRTFINLIRNSIQASANKIEIEIVGKEEKVFIRFTDNGSGISLEAQQKVFEQNFTTKKEGMGLGLNMAKRFMETIGGSISIEKSDSNGTTFLLIFQKS